MFFGLSITLVTLAVGSAYAVLMFVLKKEVKKKPVKVAALLTVALSLFALSTSNTGFTNIEVSLATSLLLITVLAGSSLVLKLRKADDILNPEFVSMTKNTGAVLFAALIVHWLSSVYFIAF